MGFKEFVMPIFKYDADVKKKIVESARAARANGRGWDESLMLAKQEGYRGGLPGLKRIMREAELNNGIVAAAAAAPKKRVQVGPGRMPPPAPPQDRLWLTALTVSKRRSMAS